MSGAVSELVEAEELTERLVAAVNLQPRDVALVAVVSLVATLAVSLTRDRSAAEELVEAIKTDCLEGIAGHFEDDSPPPGARRH